ncbi:hypothetical protein HMPREF9554_00429, partial [Treponema phagedenis F0421]
FCGGNFRRKIAEAIAKPVVRRPEAERRGTPKFLYKTESEFIT